MDPRGGETFTSGTGELALYYVPSSRAAPNGVTVTVSAGAPTYLSGAAAEYWGTAVAGPLAAFAVGKGTGTASISGSTAAVPAGSLVFSGLITGGSPGSVAPGSSAGVPFVVRAARANGSVVAADVTASAAGPQRGAFSLASSTDWYVGAAVLRPPSTSDMTPPTAPSAVTAGAASSTAVVVGWQRASDDVGVTGYTVLRNGVEVGQVPDSSRTFTDTSVAPGTTYSYAVVAFDAAGNRSVPSNAVSVTTPSASAAYVQGVTMSTGSPALSGTAQLSSPVQAGDLLVGWYGQYDATGAVQVSDDVNGVWTRFPGTTFSSGLGDISLYYKENAAAAPAGVTVTVSADRATYLQGAAAHYTGVATAGSLITSAAGKGVGTAVTSGLTGAVQAGSLVVASVMTGGSPGSTTAGTSNTVPLTPRITSPSGGTVLADVLNAAAGAQAGTFTLTASTDWYAVTAAFRGRP